MLNFEHIILQFQCFNKNKKLVNKEMTRIRNNFTLTIYHIEVKTKQTKDRKQIAIIFFILNLQNIRPSGFIFTCPTEKKKFFILP